MVNKYRPFSALPSIFQALGQFQPAFPAVRILNSACNIVSNLVKINVENMLLTLSFPSL
jgi:hypothetical protein